MQILEPTRLVLTCSKSRMKTPDNVFKVNNKDTRMTSMTLTFTHCSSVSITDFEVSIRAGQFPIYQNMLCFCIAEQNCDASHNNLKVFRSSPLLFVD